MQRNSFDIHATFYSSECPTFDVSLGHESLAFLAGRYDLGQLPRGGGMGYIGRGQGYYMTVVRITTSITVRIVARLPNQHNQAVGSKEVKCSRNELFHGIFSVYFVPNWPDCSLSHLWRSKFLRGWNWHRSADWYASEFRQCVSRSVLHHECS